MQARRLRQLLTIFGLLLGLAALATYGLRGPLAKKACDSLLFPLLARQNPGLSIQVADIDGDFLSSLILRDISVAYCSPDRACIEVTAPRTELRFNPWHLLKYHPTAINASRLLSQDGRLTISLPETTSPTTGLAPIALPPLPPALPEFEFRDWQVILHRPGLTLNAAGLKLNNLTPPVSPELKLTANLEIDALTVEYGPEARQVSLRSTLVYQAHQLELLGLRVNDRLLTDHIVLTSTEQEPLAGRGDLRLPMGSLRIEGGVDRDQLLTLAFTSLTPLDMAALPTPTSLDATSRQGSMEVAGRVRLPLDAPHRVTGAIDAEIKNFQFDHTTFNTARLHAEADGERLWLRDTVIESGADRLGIPALSLPTAALLAGDWPTLLQAGQADFSLALPTMANWLALLPDNLPAWVKALELTECSMSGRLAAGVLHLADGGCKFQGGRSQLEAVNLQLPTGASFPAGLQIQGSWRAELDNAGSLTHFFPPAPKLGGRLALTGTIAGRMQEPAANFTIQGDEISLAGVRLGAMRLDGALHQGVLSLTTLRLENGPDHLAGVASITLTEPYPHSFQLQATLADFSAYLPPTMANRFSGSGGLTINLDSTGSLLAPTTNLALQSATLHMEATAEFVTDPLSMDLVIADLSVLTDPVRLTLVAPATLRVNGAGVDFKNGLTLQGQTGTLAITGALKPEAMNLLVAAREVRCTPFIRELVDDRFFFRQADFSLRLMGSMDTPVATLTGKVSGLTDRQQTLSLDGEFAGRYSEQGLEIEQFSWQDATATRCAASGLLPLRLGGKNMPFLSGPLNFQARIDLPDSSLLQKIFPGFLSSSGPISADLALRGDWTAPQGDFNLRAADITAGPRLHFLPPGPLSFDCRGNLQKQRLEIAQCFVTAPTARLAIRGGLTGPTTLARLEDPDQFMALMVVDLNGSLALTDTSWVADRFAELRRVSGKLEGQFSLRGPARQPTAQATLSIRDGEVRTSTTLPTIRDIELDGRLDNRVVEISRLAGTLGGSPLSCTGSFGLDPGPTQLNLHLTGTDMLFYRTEGLKLRGDADLRLTGNYQAPLLQGTILLTDSRYSRNMDFLASFSAGASDKGIRLFSLQDRPLSDTRFHIRILPGNPLLLSNNLIKGTLRPDLLLTGTGELPYLRGEVYIDPTRLRLPAGQVLFDAGLIRFLENDPERPQISLQGKARTMGYEISIGVDGPYDEPVVTLSSVPPLSNEDLLLLLLAGRRPISTGEITTDYGNISTMAVYLGRDILARWFTEDDEAPDESLLDRLQLDIGRNITQQGQDTVEAMFRLADGVMYANDVLYIKTEKDVWDDFNIGLRMVFQFR